MQCRFCTRAIDVENPWGHRWIEDLGCCDECLDVRTCIEAAFGRHSIGDPNILMLIMTSLRMVEEAPIVHYMHETWNCQTHPAEVVLPELFPGRLLWGGISHGTCKDWLLYERVKLVVNCINKAMPGGAPNRLWEDSCKVRNDVSGEIAFLDFCVNYAVDRRRYLRTFAAICSVLGHGECVYIHCRSGKDRSAFTVFALLQLQYDLEEDAARAALAGRVGRDGRCLANVDVGHGPNWEWLSKELCAKGQ